jgi:leucyl/phenylalanyl-tRNA---protein transferase
VLHQTLQSLLLQSFLFLTLALEFATTFIAMPVMWLSPTDIFFPNPDYFDTPDIVAVGGDLSPERLLLAYSLGIFPWFNEGEDILWWSPDPRMVLFPDELVVSKSMRPYFNQGKFKVTYNADFQGVMKACMNQSRQGQDGTWINQDMVKSYTVLHQQGHAHSVEVWQEGIMIGGLYGIAIGKIFYGESMFANVSNASKFGFISFVNKLKEQGFLMIDCQQETRHLASLGAKLISREAFYAVLKRNDDSMENG